MQADSNVTYPKKTSCNPSNLKPPSGVIRHSTVYMHLLLILKRTDHIKYLYTVEAHWGIVRPQGTSSPIKIVQNTLFINFL